MTTIEVSEKENTVNLYNNEDETINHQKREIFWASMTLYSMQISMEQKLKKKMSEVQKLSNVTTLYRKSTQKTFHLIT